MCIFDTISLMLKYSSSHRNRAFLLSIFIYVILLLLFVYYSVKSEPKDSYKSEKLVLVELCKKKPLKKVVKIEEKVVTSKPKIIKKVVIARDKKVKMKELKKEIVIEEVVEKEVEEIEKLKEIKKEAGLTKETNTDETLEEDVFKKQIEQEQIVQNNSVDEDLIRSIEKALRKHIYYPKAARRMGLEAEVELKFKFLPNRDVVEIVIGGDVSSILLKAAKKTLIRASRDFEKVKKAVTIQVPLKFILER